MKIIKEPFFIKNLENVQADERDTIFLSICYAKNSIGKFYNRFGPINGIGGERRLNVAITRAKFNMKVISSIHGTDIDLTKVSNLENFFMIILTMLNLELLIILIKILLLITIKNLILHLKKKFIVF